MMIHESLRTALKTLTVLSATGCLLTVLAADTLAQVGQQQGLETQVITTKGTVVEVVKKGRATSLVILSEAGGEPMTVPITPRLQFAIEATGDIEFLAEKQVVSGTGTLTNGSLFVKKWTVHVGPTAKKIRPFVKESGKSIGQSRNSYDFAGTVVSRQQDTDYPDYETLITSIRDFKGKPVYIDKGATVTVSMQETELVEEGAKVEFIQQPVKGRFQVVALRVLLDKPLKAEEFFKEKPKTSSRRTSS